MIEMHPKLCQLAKAGDPDAVPGAVAEIKLDGHRMLAFVGENGVRMYARSGVDKSGKLPAIERELAEFFPAGSILDGEVVHLDAKGGDWGKVQNVLGAGSRQSTSLTFVAFDLLSLMGEDIRGYTLASRRMLLETLFGQDDYSPEHVALIEQVPYTPEFVADLLARGFEGAIVKDPNGSYRSGSRDWCKIKATATEDVVVMGAVEGKGKFAGQVGALIFGTHVRRTNETADGGDLFELVEVGQCSGMTDAQRESFTRRVDGQYAGTNMLGEVIEVQHMGKMPTGGWRHPQFKRHRTDKAATDCFVS